MSRISIIALAKGCLVSALDISTLMPEPVAAIWENGVTDRAMAAPVAASRT